MRGAYRSKDIDYESYINLPVEAWYHDAVNYVLDNDLIQGDGHETFAPEDCFSSAMFAQLFYNIENIEGKPVVTVTDTLTDVSQANWCVSAVTWAAEKGISTDAIPTAFRLDAPLQKYIWGEKANPFDVFWRFANPTNQIAERHLPATHNPRFEEYLPIVPYLNN